jgi:hypothetical protein
MKPGDLVRIYHDGKGSSGETLDGLVLDVFFVDHRAKNTKDNNSRWISSRILVNGYGPRLVNLYWDDDLDVISVSEG